MAAPRRSAIRGTVPRGDSGRPKPVPSAPEHVDDPTAPRERLDYALQRRAAIIALHTGKALDSSEHLDADPYLLRAAKHHGEDPGHACPLCKSKEDLRTVTYVYGDELGPYAGRVRQSDELPAMAMKFGRFNVYVVEVCQRCHWNFLLRSYVLGDGKPRQPLPTPKELRNL